MLRFLGELDWGTFLQNVYELEVANLKHQFQFNRKPPSFEDMKMQLDLMIAAKEKGLKEFELIKSAQKDKKQNRLIVLMIFLMLIALLDRRVTLLKRIRTRSSFSQ